VVQALLAALLLACLTIGGQQWWIKHLNDKHDAYKNKVQAATLEAYQKADATTKAIANIGEQRVTVYRDRIKTIEASTNVQIDPSGVPDCRVSDGVRDAVNSARANANSASARRTEAGMPTAPNDGRESREPRAPRG
jgi:hypothetical protein